MKKTLKILFITLMVIVAVTLITSITAHIVLTTNISHKLNRDISLSMVYLNPFTGAVYIKGLQCTEQDQQTDFMHANSLFVRINPCALPFRQVRIASIDADALFVSIVNQDSCFNFSDIPERFKTTENDTIKQHNKKSWAIHLNNIELEQSTVIYSAPAKNNNWRLSDFDLTIPGIHLAGDNSDAGISIDFPNGGGTLKVNGRYNKAKQAFQLAVKTQNLNAKHAFPIIKEHLNIHSLEALIDGDLMANGAVNDPMATNITGTITVKNIDLKDTRRHSAVICPLMHLNVKSIAMKNMTIDIEKIKIDSLAVDIVNEKNSNTIKNILHKDPDNDESTQTAQNEPTTDYDGNELNMDFDKLRLRIGEMDVQRCAVNYEDYTLPSDFKYQITGIKIQGKEVDTRSATNHIIAAGQLPDGGSMMINWRGALNPIKSSSRVVAMLRNIKITKLSPWTEYMFGYPIKNGTLSINSDNTIIHGKLSATEQIDLFKPEVGKKKKRYTPVVADIPLKMALNLLTDPKGYIKMEVPVEGDINSPTFHLSDIIGKAVGSILLKATAAPFLAMAKASNKNNDLSYIAININMPDFTLDQYEKLDLIAQMMTENEDLQLILTQQYNTNNAIADRAVFNIKKEYYESRNQGIGNLTLIDLQKITAIRDSDRDFQAFCKSKIGSKGSLANRAVKHYGEENIKEQLSEIAEHRNNFVFRYLTKQKDLDKDRIIITTDEQDALKTFKGTPRYCVTAKIPEE